MGLRQAYNRRKKKIKITLIDRYGALREKAERDRVSEFPERESLDMRGHEKVCPLLVNEWS